MNCGVLQGSSVRKREVASLHAPHPVYGNQENPELLEDLTALHPHLFRLALTLFAVSLNSS